MHVEGRIELKHVPGEGLEEEEDISWEEIGSGWDLTWWHPFGQRCVSLPLSRGSWGSSCLLCCSLSHL